MEKYKNKPREKEEVCRAEADEVKYMMLLNALNESETEENNQNPLGNEEPKSPQDH